MTGVFISWPTKRKATYSSKKLKELQVSTLSGTRNFFACLDTQPSAPGAHFSKVVEYQACLKCPQCPGTPARHCGQGGVGFDLFNAGSTLFSPTTCCLAFSTTSIFSSWTSSSSSSNARFLEPVRLIQ